MFDDFYGLQGRPFQLTPDPAFYFQSITHRKALSYLGYGLAQGEGFMVITGEVGSGKSTLVAHLVATIDPLQLTIGQVVTSKLDGDEIVHVVAQSFGLDITGHDKASALGAIEAFLHEEARAGRRCLLVVDESQNLEVSALEELRMLSNFQLGSHPLLQTLLLGQPEFRATLHGHPNLEQLRQRVIAAHHLEAMEAQEVGPYMLHRLKQVGWNGNPVFDPEVFTEIHRASGGIPRRINQIANRLMLLGAVERKARIDSAMLEEVLAEMSADTTPKDAVPVTVMPAPEPQPEDYTSVEPEPVEQFAAEPAMHDQPESQPVIDPELLDNLLAERDFRIAELEQAVVELSTARRDTETAALSPEVTALQDRVAQLEARLIEQERAMRHTLTMLIEWIEGEDGSQIAA
jgi:putative secretion ATPase (PEP-CTERM system associated)